jgi:hypothetical protein
LYFINTSLLQIHIGLHAEDRSDFRLLHKLVHINLVERVRPQDYVLEFTTLVQLVEEEAFEERAVCLLDHAIDDIDIVLYLPVARGRRLFIADFTLIRFGIAQDNAPLRLPLNYLFVELALRALDVRILESDGTTLQILSFAVSVGVPHVELACPKWNRATVFCG